MAGAAVCDEWVQIANGCAMRLRDKIADCEMSGESMGSMVVADAIVDMAGSVGCPVPLLPGEPPRSDFLRRRVTAKIKG